MGRELLELELLAKNHLRSGLGLGRVAVIAERPAMRADLLLGIEVATIGAGIAQAMALGLAREGCNVVVHGRRPEHADATIAALKELGVETFAVGGDIGTEEGCAQIIAGVQDGPGQVDILYNNAGIMGPMMGLFDFTCPA